MTDISKRGSTTSSATKHSSFKQYLPSIIGICIILCLFIPFVLYPDDTLPSNEGPSSRSHQVNKIDLSLSLRPDLPQTKNECFPTTRFDATTGFTSCYPYSGGIWSVKLDPVELGYLGINRSQSSQRSPDRASEDNFCHQLRYFGGSWYNLDAAVLSDNGKCIELHSGRFRPAVEINRKVGISDTGIVAVLDFDEFDNYGFYYDEIPLHDREALENILSMEKRSQLLVEYGAVVCLDPSTC